MAYSYLGYCSMFSKRSYTHSSTALGGCSLHEAIRHSITEAIMYYLGYYRNKLSM